MVNKKNIQVSSVLVGMFVLGYILVSMGLSFGAEESTYYESYERYTVYAAQHKLAQDYLTYELIKEAKDEKQRGSISGPSDWRGFDAQQQVHVMRDTLWQMKQDSTLMSALVVDQLVLMNDTLNKTHPSDSEGFSETLRDLKRSSTYKQSKGGTSDSSPWMAGVLVLAAAGLILIVVRRA